MALSVWNSLSRHKDYCFCTIPGIDRSSAITVIAEIGVRMAQFDFPNAYTTGLVFLSNNKSVGKRKSFSISHTRVYLKRVLVQGAHVVMKDKAKNLNSQAMTPSGQVF